MNTQAELSKQLQIIDGKGYKAYKDIAGTYRFEKFDLYIDYVQGDPFASPSRIRVRVFQNHAKIPVQLFDTYEKRIAVIDFLTRTVAKNIDGQYKRVGGSGKSGLLTIDRCGQEMLERTSVIINDKYVEVRLEVGLPAAGRRVLGQNARKILCEMLPKIIMQSLMHSAIDGQKLQEQVSLAEDQKYIRGQLEKNKWVAFVANNAILPRESGISQRPMRNKEVPFISPKSLEVELTLPNKGIVKGMAIKEGITLIVGGGYHGKSTLLNALELGVYNHISGDGREYVITRCDGMKIRAEDGRGVTRVNISPFINNLPNKADTTQFCTENASGSTSQAANISEALEMDTRLLLIDEDTSATNFMIRDERMKQLVHKDKEPITPFIDKVKSLYSQKGVSTILVVGGSGDYFGVADTVVMLDEYYVSDVTDKAKEIAQKVEMQLNNRGNDFGEITHRVVQKRSFPIGPKGVKIKAHSKDEISYNKKSIDLKNVEQLVDRSQTNAMAMILGYVREHVVDNKKTLKEVIDTTYQKINRDGLGSISHFKGHPGNLAMPRPMEVAAMINRLR